MRELMSSGVRNIIGKNCVLRMVKYQQARNSYEESLLVMVALFTLKQNKTKQTSWRGVPWVA